MRRPQPTERALAAESRDQCGPAVGRSVGSLRGGSLPARLTDGRVPWQGPTAAAGALLLVAAAVDSSIAPSVESVHSTTTGSQEDVSDRQTTSEDDWLTGWVYSCNGQNTRGVHRTQLADTVAVAAVDLAGRSSTTRRSDAAVRVAPFAGILGQIARRCRCCYCLRIHVHDATDFSDRSTATHGTSCSPPPSTCDPVPRRCSVLIQDCSQQVICRLSRYIAFKHRYPMIVIVKAVVIAGVHYSRTHEVLCICHRCISSRYTMSCTVPEVSSG